MLAVAKSFEAIYRVSDAEKYYGLAIKYFQLEFDDYEMNIEYAKLLEEMSYFKLNIQDDWE